MILCVCIASGSGDGGDSAAGEDDDESTRPEILKDNPHYRVLLA